MRRFLLHAWALGGLLGFAQLAMASDVGKGHFRKGEPRLTLRYVAAINEEAREALNDRVYVFLSDVPLDAAKLAASFHPDSDVDAQLGERSAGFVRICIQADGSECGLYYSRNQPNDSLNTSGSGEFERKLGPGNRISGRWLLSTPREFFGETFDYDLSFDVAITPAPGKPLPADGGAPGRAYRDWSAAVAAGDVARLNAMAGNESDRWRLGSEDTGNVKTAIQDLRNATPLNPKVLRGRIDGDRAVRWVEGKDRDDILRGCRVRMERVDGVWRFMGADVENLED